jgi:hypothetical protein
MVRFPKLGPESFAGALVQIAIAFAAGWLLVPPGIKAALAFEAPTGPLLAIFVFALPSLAYLFLTSLWAMRLLQQMMRRGSRR